MCVCVCVDLLLLEAAREVWDNSELPYCDLSALDKLGKRVTTEWYRLEEKSCLRLEKEELKIPYNRYTESCLWEYHCCLSGNVEKDVLLGIHFEVILCMEKVPVSTQGSIPWSREKEWFLYLLIPLGYQRRLNMLHGKVK